MSGADDRAAIHAAIAESDARRADLRADVHADVLAGRTETPAIHAMRALLREVESLEERHTRLCRNVHGAPASMGGRA
jgi:hypothetical protein